MKRFLHIIFLATLFLSGGTFLTHAQGPQNTDDGAGKVTTSYDEAKNETEIELKRLFISQTDDRIILLNVSSSFSGKKLKKRPKDVIFIIQTVSVGAYQYPDTMALKIKADGKNLSDILMLNLDKRSLDERFLETIGTRMKYKVFKRLAGAETVELKLHNTDIKLDKTHLAKLNEFEKALSP